MGRFGCFVFGLIVGGTSVFISLKYHVVRANDGFHLIGKTNASFGQTYVDIRSFEFRDWSSHAALAAAITHSDKAYLITDQAVDKVRESVHDYLDIRLGQPQ